MPRVYRRVPLARRAWAKVDGRRTDECWPWTGNTDAGGYGVIWVDTGRLRKAHRVIWEDVNGPIPAGTELDHTCHNIDPICAGGPSCLHRRCCNPAHLEPVTHKTNSLRGKSVLADKARQTHCIHGHEFTPENIYAHPTRDTRMCRICMAETSRKRSEVGVGPCSEPGCAGRAFSRGWCKPHYMRWWRANRTR